MAAFVPKGYELVYDNYNALVFGFGPTLRASDAVVSVAGYPRWVTLFFLMGTNLEDPEGLLQGAGRRVRSIRLEPFEILQSQPVRALLEQALARHAPAFQTAPALSVIVRSVSEKQRPRKPAVASSSAKRTTRKPLHHQ